MGYVKTLYIDGLKRFEHFEIEFNEHLSILVGENEAGKSTILEAIRIVLNQLYWNADKSVLQDLFNLENVRAFQNNPRLNLRNVIWIAENHYLSLKNVEPQTSIFFEKADDNEFLQLLLSKKVILVEGATEYLLLPKFYEKKTGRTVENDGISIISCNGISYKRYLEIAEETGKRIAVITDNDHEQTKIDDANEFNQHNEKQHVFMGATMEDWTWEACVYNCNKEKLDTMIQVQDGAEYLFHRTNYGQVLGKMLNNKVDTAYQMLISEEDFVIPGYVEEAIEWLNE